MSGCWPTEVVRREVVGMGEQRRVVATTEAPRPALRVLHSPSRRSLLLSLAGMAAATAGFSVVHTARADPGPVTPAAAAQPGPTPPPRNVGGVGASRPPLPPAPVPPPPTAAPQLK